MRRKHPLDIVINVHRCGAELNEHNHKLCGVSRVPCRKLRKIIKMRFLLIPAHGNGIARREKRVARSGRVCNQINA